MFAGHFMTNVRATLLNPFEPHETCLSGTYIDSEAIGVSVITPFSLALLGFIDDEPDLFYA